MEMKIESPFTTEHGIESYKKNFGNKSVELEKTKIYVVELPTTWEEYLNSLGQKMRKNLRRVERELSKRRVVIDNVRRPELNLYNLFVGMHKKYVGSYMKEETPFQFDSFKNYIYDIVFKFGGVFVLNMEGNIASMLIYADYKNCRHHLNIANNMDFIEYSVGKSIVACAIKDAILGGFKYFSFGEGFDKYKLEWGCKEVEVLRIKSKFKLVKTIYSPLRKLIPKNIRMKIKGILYR